MKGHLGKLTAVVLATAGVGVFAAPAGADAPLFNVTISCQQEGDGMIVGNEIGPAGTAQQIIPVFNEILRENNITCVPGTRKITIEKVQD